MDELLESEYTELSAAHLQMLVSLVGKNCSNAIIHLGNLAISKAIHPTIKLDIKFVDN